MNKNGNCYEFKNETDKTFETSWKINNQNLLNSSYEQGRLALAGKVGYTVGDSGKVGCTAQASLAVLSLITQGCLYCR